MKLILTKLRALLRPQDRRRVAFIVVLMILTAFVQTAGVASVMPFLTVLADPDLIVSRPLLSSIYDFGNFKSPSAFLHFLGLAAFVIYMTGTALQALTQWVVTRFANMQQYHLSRRLMEGYLSRPYTFYLTRNSGDLSKTVLHETAQATGGALLPAMRMASYILLAASIIFLLLLVQPVLAMGVAVALGSIYGLIYFVSKQWLSRIGKDRVQANRQRYTTANEAFAGAKEIRLLGREQDYLERFREPSRRFALHEANSTLFQNLPQYAIEAVAFGGVLLLVLFLMSDTGGLASALPLIGLYGLAGKQLIPAFQKIFGTASSIRYNLPSVDSVLNDLKSQSGVEGHIPQHRVEPLPIQEALSVRNLTYTYPSASNPVLDGLSLDIPARTTVGFVGASGAGKSTLVDIILGLLQPQAGEIRVDGKPICTDNVRSWQANIGYVPQHIFLADQSVRSNIALGIPEHDINDEAIVRAARLANLHDFVSHHLPNSYETVIGERGIRLSGGQRQRIGIARALYRNPEVLIFDEATSALDNSTEKAVMEAIHNLKGHKTIILVAHRLSTIRPCNTIYVLQNGQIIESGSWDELHRTGTHLRQLSNGTDDN